MRSLIYVISLLYRHTNYVLNNKTSFNFKCYCISHIFFILNVYFTRVLYLICLITISNFLYCIHGHVYLFSRFANPFSILFHSQHRLFRAPMLFALQYRTLQSKTSRVYILTAHASNKHITRKYVFMYVNICI